MADTMNLLEWKLRLAELFDAYVTKDAEREDGDAEVEEVEEIYEALRDHIRTDPVLSGSAQPSPPADAALADVTGMIIRDACESDVASPDHPDTVCINVDDLTQIVSRHVAALRARAVPDGFMLVRPQWIRDFTAKNSNDHACAQCVPHSDMLIDGFVCPYHQALTMLAASKEGK